MRRPAGIGASDVDAIKRFYTKVLGFEEIPRPGLGFGGHWLAGLGVMIHIIEKDPSVPLRTRNWKVLPVVHRCLTSLKWEIG